MSGTGLCYDKNGNEYFGEHEYGKLHGFGTFTKAHRLQYQGYWKNGLKDGTGAEYLPEEDRWEYAIWKNGNKVKQIILKDCPFTSEFFEYPTKDKIIREQGTRDLADVFTKMISGHTAVLNEIRVRLKSSN